MTTSKRSIKTPTATLLAPALEARKHNPKIAPWLLLDALQQRIREVVPGHDPDLWVAARKLARDQDDIGIESAYYGLMRFDVEYGQRGDFNEEQWEDHYAAAEITIRLLERENA